MLFIRFSYDFICFSYTFIHFHTLFTCFHTHSNAKKQNVPSSISAKRLKRCRTQGNLRLSRCAAGKNCDTVVDLSKHVSKYLNMVSLFCFYFFTSKDFSSPIFLRRRIYGDAFLAIFLRRRNFLHNYVIFLHRRISADTTYYY